MIRSQPGPKWALWDYGGKYLPAAFHKSLEQFGKVINWIQTKPYCSDAREPYPRDKAAIVCLAIGLILRDIQGIQFVEGEDNQDDHLKGSVLSWGEVGVLMSRCREMEQDIKACLEAAACDLEQRSGLVESRISSSPSKVRWENIVPSNIADG
jgi:hypothetical protein